MDRPLWGVNDEKKMSRYALQEAMSGPVRTRGQKTTSRKQGWRVTARNAKDHSAEQRFREALPMSFFVGLLLFVVVVGILDAKLPWPSRRDPRSRP